MGYLATAFQLPTIVYFGLGLAILYAVVHLVGKPVPDGPVEEVV